jgi:hypothetical protein
MMSEADHDQPETPSESQSAPQSESGKPDSNPVGGRPDERATGRNQEGPRKGRPDAAARTAIIVIAFAVLVVGMGLDSVAGISLTVLAIAMFLVAIVLGIAFSKK